MVDKKQRESKTIEAEEARLEELNFSFQQVNDYPLSDKTLVVSPQIIPLSTEELPTIQIEDI